jgi:hypothetical protein
VEGLVRLVEARDGARFLAAVRAPPAFFAVAGDPDRLVVVVRAPRVVFTVVRFLGCFFVVCRRRDFDAE